MRVSAVTTLVVNTVSYPIKCLDEVGMSQPNTRLGYLQHYILNRYYAANKQMKLEVFTDGGRAATALGEVP